ncbi:unnamed protein product, partial [marine sediment metagenome]
FDFLIVGIFVLLWLPLSKVVIEKSSKQRMSIFFQRLWLSLILITSVLGIIVGFSSATMDENAVTLGTLIIMLVLVIVCGLLIRKAWLSALHGAFLGSTWAIMFVYFSDNFRFWGIDTTQERILDIVFTLLTGTLIAMILGLLIGFVSKKIVTRKSQLAK